MKRIVIGLIIFVLAVIVFIAIELLFIKYNGTPVAAPEIPRAVQELGAGPELTYVVMGDSSSIGQGADYDESYSLNSAKHLAKKYKVKFINLGISGARVRTVFGEQTAKAAAYKPDVVLIAAGANDTTHFTNLKEIQEYLTKTVEELKKANPRVKIIVTRSAALDSVPRFPWPAKQLLGLRTRQVNKAFQPIIQKYGLTAAPIAERTREPFLRDPTLLAADKFHPNGRGYALWTPVINEALDQALAK